MSTPPMTDPTLKRNTASAADKTMSSTRSHSIVLDGPGRTRPFYSTRARGSSRGSIAA